MQDPIRTLSLVALEADERRRGPRYERSAEAILAAVDDGTRCPAVITDVSLYGCCVTADAAWLRSGRYVTIALAGGLPVDAVVRWTRDGEAGVELLHALPTHRTDWRALID